MSQWYCYCKNGHMWRQETVSSLDVCPECAECISYSTVRPQAKCPTCDGEGHINQDGTKGKTMTLMQEEALIQMVRSLIEAENRRLNHWLVLAYILIAASFLVPR